MASDETLIDAEAHGLVTMAGDEVRLAHPLYGEAVRAAAAAASAQPAAAAGRGRSRRGDAFGPDDALRVARLRLDAGAALAPDLALDARAGRQPRGRSRPRRRAGGAARARTPTCRRDAAGAGARDAQPQRGRRGRPGRGRAARSGDPNAHDYLRQRLWLYQWGLRRRRGDRCADGPRRDVVADDDGWRRFTAGSAGPTPRIADGLSAPPPTPGTSDDPGVSERCRARRCRRCRLSAFLAGRGDAAAAEAFAARPRSPGRQRRAAALGPLS